MFVLQNGVLENYCPSYDGSIFNINSEAKYNVFLSEREWIEQEGITPTDIQSRYSDLCQTLDLCCDVREVSYDSYLNYTISDLIYNVQMAYRKGEFINQDGFINSRTIEWSDYQRIMELDSFIAGDHNSFSCKVRLKAIIDPNQRLIEFSESTHASNFNL